MRNDLRALMVAVAISTVGGVAHAGPHFITVGNPAITSDGDLTISWKEAGLGSTAVTYDLVAQTLKFNWQCFTKSGNKPQGSPNSGGQSEAVASVSITPRNGQITEPDGALLLGPQIPPSDVSTCTGKGLQFCLTYVEYDGILFEDETNDVIGLGGENGSGGSDGTGPSLNLAGQFGCISSK